MLKSVFNKVAGLRLATLLKETPTQVLSCEICCSWLLLYFYSNFIYLFAYLFVIYFTLTKNNIQYLIMFLQLKITVQTVTNSYTC